MLAGAGAAQQRLPDPSHPPGDAHMQAICAHDPDPTLTGAAATAESAIGAELPPWRVDKSVNFGLPRRLIVSI